MCEEGALLQDHVVPEMGKEMSSRVGCFRLHKNVVLAASAYSSCVLGTHQATGEKVAVRVICKDLLDANPAYASRLAWSIRRQHELKHPGICKVLRVFNKAKNFYAIMEHPAQGSMLDYIRRHGRLAEPKARRLFAQLVDTVYGGCHAENVLHRYINLHSVHIGDGDVVKLTDFHFAGCSTPADLTALVHAAPHYAAPELFRQFAAPESSTARQTLQSEKLDAWCLGIVLHCMLYGRVPFHQTTIAGLGQAICQEPLHLNAQLSKEVKSLLHLLLAKDPHLRLSVGKIRNHPWFVEANINAPPPVSDSVRLQQAMACELQCFGIPVELQDDPSSRVGQFLIHQKIMREGLGPAIVPDICCWQTSSSANQDAPDLPRSTHVAGQIAVPGRNMDCSFKRRRGACDVALSDSKRIRTMNKHVSACCSA